MIYQTIDAEQGKLKAFMKKKNWCTRWGIQKITGN